MASIGELAYVGHLVADKVSYNTLEPGLTGFVHNPLNATLQGAGNNIDLQGGNLTAATINYSSLNPPLPTNGVFTPMVQNLDGGNFDIINCNNIAATSGTFTTSLTTGSITNGGNIQSGSLTTTGNILAGNQLLGGTGNITGNFVVGGTTTINNTFKARAVKQTPLICDVSASSSFNLGQYRQVFLTSTSTTNPTISLTFPDGDVDNEGGIVEIVGESLFPYYPSPSNLSINISYTMKDTGGTIIGTDTLSTLINRETKYIKYKCLRDSAGAGVSGSIIRWVFLEELS